ncbi:A disintegrin and metalloproteinase with thrombospondin motifs 6 isoform X3 [Bactrocera tryoni]|uniref:A disintegrin and metalloproteinase with thrombospondin motifs 6 isoform X3 n=1 Tax=Bactrocera tryoni TaxID=59916 RepID=UPI001A99888C|nr:A disintegrin and metalloproteinase with thrombospondin motifs 6 isoform X3 [Bactrocera tryoni]
MELFIYIVPSILQLLCIYGAAATDLLYGLHSDKLKSGAIVIPKRVNANGDFLTFDLAYRHDQNYRHEHSRRRRNIAKTLSKIHYLVDMDNGTMHLDLEPHTYFLAPSLIIERHRRDIRSRKAAVPNTDCHFHGKVRGHQDSNVAISTCEGLVGHIKTKRHEYYIEPSKNDPADNSSGHPHVLFQRSSLKPKKHYVKYKQREELISNCGTKEPKRYSGTRLEWQAHGKVKIQGGRKLRHKYPFRSYRRHQQHSIQCIQGRYPRKFNQAPQIKLKYETASDHINTINQSDSTIQSQTTDYEKINNDKNIINTKEMKRSKRSISSPRHVEALIVADATMVAFHSKLETYVLTIMNMVSALYKDPSIGNSIEIVVVKIILLEEHEAHPDLNLTQNAQKNLDKFCSFGMFHDTAKTGCHPRVGSIVHIMTPTFGADTLQVSWSNCSRKYITQFLDQGFGDCLDDAPTPKRKYVYPALPPGVLFDVETQCRLQFNLTEADVNASSCTSMDEICSTLWCRVNGECVTNLRPTAPGTSCGDGKGCHNGKCIPNEQAHPINGSWGAWSKWSDCSRTCGGGVSTQKRECNNPVPANGGLFCIGERKRYKICNHQPCPVGEISFRAHQCSKYDNVYYQGSIYKWLPFFDNKNPCKLLCTDVDDTIIANWGDTVKDGTPCGVGTNDMCIDGICKKVGCDWVLDSNMREDQCGVCGGKSDRCKLIKEVFEENVNVTDGYVEIVTIPSKARQIIIREISNSKIFLGLSMANSSNFYLNGDGLISMPGEFRIAGTESLYDRVDEQEIIKIPQPIENAITVHAIIRGDGLNTSIRYEFALPALNNSQGVRYSWKLGEWTDCTSSCGGGVQYRIAQCYADGEWTPSSEYCWTFAENKRPTRRIRVCNRHQCPAHWWTGPWQYCPVTCKWSEDLSPVRRRTVMCLDQNEVVVEDDRCNIALKPPSTEPCSHNLPKCKVNNNMENVVLQMQNI